MSIFRKINTEMNLSLQLYDGEASLPKVVKCVLRDKLGAVLGSEVILSHVGDGEFKESSTLMPANDIVTAHFTVYNVDGITVDTKYSIAKDLYLRDYTAEIVATNLDAKVSSVSGDSGYGFIGIELEAELESIILDIELESEDTLDLTLEPSVSLSGELECVQE